MTRSLSKLPDGPRGKLGNTIGYARDPLRRFRRLADQYGDPFMMRTMFGTWFVTGNPDAIRTVFGTDPASYDSFIGDALEAIAGPSSLVVVQGEAHKRERKLLMPHFHGERMRSHRSRLAEIATRHVAAWPRKRSFVLHDALTRLALDVIVEEIFGIEREAAVAVGDALVERDAATKPGIVFFKGLRRRFWGVGPWARFRRAADRLDGLFAAEIRARRASSQPRADLLQHMIDARYDDGSAVPDQAIFDQLVTVAIAGHETTAITLSWAVYWLCRDPDLRRRLQDELARTNGLDEILRAPLLSAVIDETLRLTHPGTDVMRKLNRPLQLLDWELPAGTGINVCIPLLHQRPELFPEPTRFRPERFLERSFAPHEYVPFGGGHRRCIGAAFALYEMKIVLATILMQTDIRIARDEALEPVRWNVFLAPRGGVDVIIDQ